MKKERKDNSFIKKPIYEGGNKALSAFISTNLKYPKRALDEKVAGTVVLKYTIDHQGKVIDAKVISGIGHGCDAEAVRLVKLLEFKVPKSRGIRVTFQKDIKIHFRLPKVPVKKVPIPAPKPIQAAPTQYNYNYVATPAPKVTKKNVKPKKKGASYTITVNIGEQKR